MLKHATGSCISQLNVGVSSVCSRLRRAGATESVMLSGDTFLVTSAISTASRALYASWSNVSRLACTMTMKVTTGAGGGAGGGKDGNTGGGGGGGVAKGGGDGSGGVGGVRGGNGGG